MRSFLKWVWTCLEVIIIIYVIAMTAFILSKNKYGYTQFGDYVISTVSLLDERNNTNLTKGDLLVVKKTNDIGKGDLIYYFAVYNDRYIINSNIVTEVKNDDYSSLYTIKDEDGVYTISSARVLGKYTHVYNNLGTVINVLESRLGFLFLVLLPIMIIFIYQVYEFVVILRYEKIDNPKEISLDKDNKNKDKVKKVDNKSKKSDDIKEDIEIL